jgi:hypothetical protein
MALVTESGHGGYFGDRVALALQEIAWTFVHQNELLPHPDNSAGWRTRLPQSSNAF